ncbi:MAG: sigma 54-interacting transcriptional regulator [Vicinamibacterales bacterium]
MSQRDRNAVSSLPTVMTTTSRSSQIIGSSEVILDLKRAIDRIARADAKVLITGESGTGKELVARALHESSSRAQAPFAAVNCAGLADGLLESELFGHLKGSFTGAYRDKAGKFEVADHGTMLMDEVGEMSLRMQGMLLRFLETGEIQKIGSDQAASRVDVRIIASTNRNLRQMAAEGKFREDLYYRLNVIHLSVPPLRDRRDDIPDLVQHFLAMYADRHVGPVRSVTPDAMSMMADYQWPGNVRELQNVIERIALTGREAAAGPEHLPSDLRRARPASVVPNQPFRERRRTVSDELYSRMIEQRESFWTAVYPLYVQRDITRANIRDLVRKALQESRGNYKIVAKLFNLEQREYKRFLNFLRKNECQLPFREYRGL